MTGCGITETDSDGNPIADSKSSGGSAAALDEKTLNIYTALEDEQVAEYLEPFQTAHPDVTINITRDSTGIITAKLLAEKDNPQADVV